MSLSSGSTWDSINDFLAWGNCFCITFIVVSSQFFTYFASQYRIPLIRLICLVSLQNDFLSIHGFCSGRIIFPCSHRNQDPVPTPTWCGHRSNYQIMSTFCFSIVCYFNLFIYWDILYSSLRTYFPLLILGSLCMPKIISTILKKVFWIIKGEIILVCLPAKPLHVLVLSLAWPAFLSTAQYLSLPSGKDKQIFYFVSFWFYFITVITVIVKFWILIFTLLRILRITVWEFPKGVLLLLSFLLFLLVDL